MLRTLLLVFAAALTLLGAILLLGGHVHAGANALGGGLVLFLGTAFERWRYRSNAAPPGAEWQPTGERFEDPETHKPVQVYYDPRSGERRYVSDSDPPPGAGASHPAK